MNKIFIHEESADSLIVVFLGWGFPPESFAGLRKRGSDILLLAGYEGLDGEGIEQEIRESFGGDAGQEPWYNEIVVIGWSFGVKVASMFLSRTSIPVTMRLAVNGTEYHVDDLRGIPEQIFDGTLSGLSERTLEKFRLRCAGSRENLAKLFAGGQGNSRIEELRGELEWFGSLPRVPEKVGRSIWDKVVIGTEDRIFPPRNQLTAWEGYDVFSIKGMGHVPDFQWILDNFVVDKRKVCDKFATASPTYTNNAFAQQVTARKLYDRFIDVFHKTAIKGGERLGRQLDILELGYGDGAFTRLYAPELMGSCRTLTLSDILDTPSDSILMDFLHGYDNGGQATVKVLHMDAESAGFAKKCLGEDSYDLILSSSMFQWLNSPAMMLRRCAVALRHGGIIAVSFYGPGTFREIYETVGMGLKYPSPEWMKKIAIESGLDIEVCVAESETVLFSTPADALRHIKLTGVNGLPGAASPVKARRLLERWPLDVDGKAPLTFIPVYMVLSKK